MTSTLYDNHNRPINYLRLAVTDRCNLRCFYCMPEEGINYVPRKALMTYEEMERMVRVLVKMGINKVRITGGEPFLRKDLMYFLARLHAIEGLDKINLTTNGTLSLPHIPQFKEVGINSVNLSLDTLDPQRFFEITRRNSFDTVWKTLEALLEANIQVKINMVVMDGRNTMDILPMVALTKKYPIDVRFIEEMPFNGTGDHYPQLQWNHHKILAEIQTAYPTSIHKLPTPPSSTAQNYHIEGHQGNFGIIAAYSRTFCGTCNRIRVTPQGLLKTCLYDNGIFNVKSFMRNGADDAQLTTLFLEALGNRAKDGFEAEQRRVKAIGESMASIGG